MRLRFDSCDDDAYLETRGALLDDLYGWLERDEPERARVVADVKCFLDWRYWESVGVLDEFAPSDVAEFLLEWCPRQMKGRPDDAVNLCFAVGVYLDFMAATGRLVGGVDRAARLRRLADDLAPTVLAEARNPTPVVDLCDEDAPKRYELPFVYAPPPIPDVEAAAAAAPLLAKLDALRDYLGPDGKQLTEKGKLELADGQALVELLDTGDEMEVQLGDETYRIKSTASLWRLNFIVGIARKTGAVRIHDRHLLPAKAWETRPIVARAEALFAAIVELGPLESRCAGHLSYPDGQLQLLDDGIVHWLAPLVAHPTPEQPFEALLKWAESVTSEQMARNWPDEMDSFEVFAEEGMGRIFEILEEAGVVRWTDREEVPQRVGRGYWTGGILALTALGRHVLPDYLDDAGYVLRRADGLADCDGADLIDVLFLADETQQNALIAGWQVDRPAVERVQMLTEAIVASSSAAGRMMGFIALHKFDIEVAEPLVRQLLDTPVAGHAALWLIQLDRADHETLGNFVDVAVLVDVFSADLESPEELCRMFDKVPDPLPWLERMWRHPAPETALVLDALGNHLPDKTLAKAARKAAVRHRSWMANRPGAGCQNSNE